MMGKIIALANQKGGVGKTTTAVNLACCLGNKGLSVLLCDFDPQSNASSGAGAPPSGKRTIYDALAGEIDTARCIVTAKYCDVLPSDVRLAAAEQELATQPDRESFLKKLLEPFVDKYDFIIIDCPPSLGLLTLNAMVAADSVLIPMQCEYFSLEGLSKLIQTMRSVRRAFNPELSIEGILFTMYNGQANLTLQVAEEVKKHFSKELFKTVIPRNVRLAEAPSHGMPIIEYDRHSRGAEAYCAVTEELLRNNGR